MTSELPEGTKNRHIGIMGGTFNPIHNGHIAIARAALRELELDSVLFIPSGVSYLKEGMKIADKEDRLNMTAASVADDPSFFVSRIEIDRPGKTYTADTLEQLDELYPGNTWYFLMGADSLLMFDKWVRPADIAKRAVLVCAVRNDAGRDELERKAEYLRRELNARISILGLERMDISSSDIRRKLAAGEDAADMLPAGCLKYIREHGLYTDD